jgi:hypothetical protein
MVAGLDVPTNSDEFLRADCAPRGAADGVLTVADWVQAGRYAMKLDPITVVTPPVSAGAVPQAKAKGSQTPGRILQVGTVSAQRGQTVSVPVSLVCLTNESAVGLTISYNTNQLQLLSVSPVSGLLGVREYVNTNQPGKVGLALASSTGNNLPAGTNKIATLLFATRPSASGTAALTLDGTVVKLQTADVQAAPIATSYINGAVILPSQPSIVSKVSGGKLQFNWLLASGTFQVQTASQPSGPWTTIVLPLTSDGTNVSCALSTANLQQYFRLTGQ